MKAWIIYKFRQDSSMQVPTTFKIIEGHDDYELAKNSRDLLFTKLSPQERMVGWNFSLQETEIHVKTS